MDTVGWTSPTSDRIGPGPALSRRHGCRTRGDLLSLGRIRPGQSGHRPSDVCRTGPRSRMFGGLGGLPVGPAGALPAAVDDVGAVLDAVLGGAVDIDPDRWPSREAVPAGRWPPGWPTGRGPARVPAVAPTGARRPALTVEGGVRRHPGFDGPAAELMWRYYLGAADCPPDAVVAGPLARGRTPLTEPADAAVPAALADLTGLPPALITCSELDPLRDRRSTTRCG